MARWTKEEIELLKETYLKIEYRDEIAQHFPTRSYRNVYLKCWELGLDKTRSIPVKTRKCKERECKNCGKNEYFAKNLCETCYRKKMVDDNPERTRRWAKESHQRNRGKRLQYNYEHREQHAAIKRAWVQKDREHVRENNRRYARSTKGQYQELRRAAYKKNLDLEITFDEFSKIRNSSCAYCVGSLPETGSGLDRKDSAKGYLIDNVVPCCGDCNVIKSDILTHEEMLIGMKAILEFRNSKNKGE